MMPFLPQILLVLAILILLWLAYKIGKLVLRIAVGLIVLGLLAGVGYYLLTGRNPLSALSKRLSLASPTFKQPLPAGVHARPRTY